MVYLRFFDYLYMFFLELLLESLWEMVLNDDEKILMILIWVLKKNIWYGFIGKF